MFITDATMAYSSEIRLSIVRSSYTADFTVGVWVSNFDRTPLAGATGVTGAGPVFHSVMLAAHRHLTPGAGLDAEATLVPSVPAS